MALNPSIILAGRQPDIVNALRAGTDAAQAQADFMHQSEYRNALRQYGAGAYQGDEAARAMLAGFDPLAMQGMAQTDLGMDATRLGMDQTRQQMRILDDQNRRAAEEAFRQAGAAAAAAELDQMLRALQAGASAPDAATWDALVASLGAEELVGQYDRRQSLMDMHRDLEDVYQGAFGATGGEPFTLSPGETRFGPDGQLIASVPTALDPGDRYVDVGGTLIDLLAPGGPGAAYTPPADPFAGTMVIGGSLVAPDGNGGFSPVYAPPVNPAEREMREDVNGVLRYADTGEEVFPGVTPIAESPTFRPATPEEAAAYGAQAGQIDTATGRFYANDVPTGMSLETTSDGGIRLIQGPGVTGTGRPLTETQSRDLGFATRARAALDVLDPIASTLTDRTQIALGWAPMGVGRELQSADFQVAQNAATNFLIAILRKDTGAAVTPSEEQLYGDTFLPRPGDSPEVLAQKAEARQLAVAGLEAGLPPEALLLQGQAIMRGTGQTVPEVAPAAPAPATAGESVPQDGPAVGQIVDGYEFLGGDPAVFQNWRRVP